MIHKTHTTLENTEGVIKKSNPEKLAKKDTQDQNKQQNNNTTQYVLDTTIRKQTDIA